MLDNEKEYFVCLDSTFPHDMDIPILVINKVDGQISVHQIVEKGFMNKLNKAKLVARKLELDEDE